METTRRPVRRSREFWSRTVAAWRRSGQSQAAFAAAHGLAESTLSRWTLKLRDADGGASPVPSVIPTFIDLTADADPSVPKARMLFGGVVVEFRELPPPEYVAAVSRLAEGTPC